MASSIKNCEIVSDPLVTRIVLPGGDPVRKVPPMTNPEAIKWLKLDEERKQAVVQVMYEFAAFPLEGAYALSKAIEKLFGFSVAKAKEHFFGSDPPKLVKLDVGNGEMVDVPWGQLTFPGIDGGVLEMNTSYDDSGFPQFYLSGFVRNMDKPRIDELIDETKRILKNDSIYSGRAVEMNFRDQRGDLIERLPMQWAPRFMHPVVRREQLIFDDDLQAEINHQIFAPIIYGEAFKRDGIPEKHSVVCSGGFGTGKTSVAAATATLCEEMGVGFIHLKDCRDIPRAIQFGVRNGHVVIFTEDIENALGLDRTDAVNQILNMIDGVDSKGHTVMVVATTNNLHLVQEAALRPGRTNRIIEFGAPSAATAVKLVRLIGGDQIDPNDPLDGVGEAYAGLVPAFITEGINGAKRAAIWRTEGSESYLLTSADLIHGAREMQKHRARMERKTEVDPIDVELRVAGRQIRQFAEAN